MALPATFTRHLFTVQDVNRMAEAGVFEGDCKHVELIDGELIDVPPQGPPHASLVEYLDGLLRTAYPEHRVRPALPLDLGEKNLPEPDLAVVRGSTIDRTRHPRGNETVLVIEISYSSQSLDHEKASRYARGGVPVYWIVDVARRQVEVYTAPLRGRGLPYGDPEVFGELRSLGLPDSDATWNVADILGAA